MTHQAILTTCLLRRPAPAQGMAALTVVMMLFFVMALVAGYTNRNLIFEQRISANNYRSTKALEAADAGVEWAVAMLNGGRVTTNCQSSNLPQDDDFRRRFLADAPEDSLNGPGGYSLAWGVNLAGRMFPSCINRDGALTCICPSALARTPEISAPADGVGSAFAVSFLLPGRSPPGAAPVLVKATRPALPSPVIRRRWIRSSMPWSRWVSCGPCRLHRRQR
ncbi:MAG: hypothetical protein CFE45_24350 [Burkholderiales bacterium PBB5]|nr:MAG: hypothetical protein CFE45_24350 [Burkholderiales bacterium PBB5]